MRFPYLAKPVNRPVYSLGGSGTRHYPVFAVSMIGPLGSWVSPCIMDSAADDTIFPLSLAATLGVDLTNAPVGQSRQVGGIPLSYRYAHVQLHLSDGLETCRWQAIVGFLDAPMRWALLGLTGFLNYFDTTLLGHDQEVLVVPNASFVGSHIIH